MSDRPTVELPTTRTDEGILSSGTSYSSFVRESPIRRSAGGGSVINGGTVVRSVEKGAVIRRRYNYEPDSELSSTQLDIETEEYAIERGAASPSMFVSSPRSSIYFSSPRASHYGSRESIPLSDRCRSPFNYIGSATAGGGTGSGAGSLSVMWPSSIRTLTTSPGGLNRPALTLASETSDIETPLNRSYSPTGIRRTTTKSSKATIRSRPRSPPYCYKYERDLPLTVIDSPEELTELEIMLPKDPVKRSNQRSAPFRKTSSFRSKEPVSKKMKDSAETDDNNKNGKKLSVSSAILESDNDNDSSDNKKTLKNQKLPKAASGSNESLSQTLERKAKKGLSKLFGRSKDKKLKENNSNGRKISGDSLNNAADKENVNVLDKKYSKEAQNAVAWIKEHEIMLQQNLNKLGALPTTKLIDRHDKIQKEIDGFAENIAHLDRNSDKLRTSNSPDAKQLAHRQARINRAYAGLQQLAYETRRNLAETKQLQEIVVEIDDLLQWIADQEMVAGSQELGESYRHVKKLQEKFEEFTNDMKKVGNERVESANKVCDLLITNEHSKAYTVALWKDAVNEAWENLMELIDTRVQLLQSSRIFHKFFYDSNKLLEKMKKSTKKDQAALEPEFTRLLAEFDELKEAYAGQKASEIIAKEQDLRLAWKRLP